jgi:hypothetical protein
LRPNLASGPGAPGGEQEVDKTVREFVAWYGKSRGNRVLAAPKVESDAVVHATVLELRVPLNIGNPSTVIGHSATGESGQTLGLATTVPDFISGRLRAIPGGSSIFVHVVTVDYLTRFLAFCG